MINLALIPTQLSKLSQTRKKNKSGRRRRRRRRRRPGRTTKADIIRKRSLSKRRRGRIITTVDINVVKIMRLIFRP
jgi:hypothetical protein